MELNSYLIMQINQLRKVWLGKNACSSMLTFGGGFY